MNKTLLKNNKITYKATQPSPSPDFESLLRTLSKINIHVYGALASWDYILTLTIFGTSPKDPAGEASARISTSGNIKQKEIFRVIKSNPLLFYSYCMILFRKYAKSFCPSWLWEWFGFNIKAQKQLGNTCIYIDTHTYIFQISQTISQFWEICYCFWMLGDRQQWNEGVTNTFHIETSPFFNR